VHEATDASWLRRGKQYASSLTDRYLEEKDFLRGIIEKTHQ
jgi:hypothetical protein